MKIKLDENLPDDLVEYLASDLDASSVKRQSICGIDDASLVKICARENRALVTLDLDFSNPAIAFSEKHSGIILLRLGQQSKEKIFHSVLQLVKNIIKTDLTNKLVIFDGEKIRIKEP